MDSSLLLSSPIFRGSFRAIYLLTLSLEDILARISIRSTYVDCQILRIVTPSRNLANANVNFRMRRNLGNRAEEVSYTRIYLCRVFSDRNPQENSKLFYILQKRNTSGGSTHADIWNRNPDFRDNGTITVGSFVRIVNPAPIERFMQTIPLVCTDMRAVALRKPSLYNAIPINNNLDGNQAKAFVYNHSELQINRFSVLTSNCTGLHCDKQDVASETRSTCGCYGGSPFRSNLAFIFGISFRTQDGQTRVMPNFSSLTFQKLFLTAPIPPEVTAASLQGTDIGLELEDSIVRQVRFGNANDAWTKVGWAKRGLTTDQALVGGTINDENRISAQDINVHVVEIIPTNRDLLSPTTAIGRQFRNMRFDVNRLVFT